MPVDDLLNASLSLQNRNKQLLGALLSEATGLGIAQAFHQAGEE